MYYYRRLELRKTELQDKVERKLGIRIEDPELLVHLAMDLGNGVDLEIHEDYDDDEKGPVIVVEGQFRRDRRSK